MTRLLKLDKSGSMIIGHTYPLEQKYENQWHPLIDMLARRFRRKRRTKQVTISLKNRMR